MSDDSIRRFHLDKRVAERNIKKGLLSREEYDAWLNSLVDVADNAEEVGVRLHDDPHAPPPSQPEIADDDDDIDDEDDDEEEEEEKDAPASEG